MPIPPVPRRKSRPRRRRLRWNSGATVANALRSPSVDREPLWGCLLAGASAGSRPPQPLSSHHGASLLPPTVGPTVVRPIPPAASLPSFWALDGGASPQLALYIACCLLRAVSAAAACHTTLEPLGRLLGSHMMFTSQLEEFGDGYPSSINAGSFPDECLEGQALLDPLQALSAAGGDQVVWPNCDSATYERRPVSEGGESSTTAATEDKQVLRKSRKSRQSSSCAPCTFQHKLCKDNCDLKIPSMHPSSKEKVKKWKLVRKVYSSSTILKMMERLERVDRETAMQSLIHEATCRNEDPLRGAAGVIGNLSRKITKLEAANSKLQLRVSQLEIALQTYALQEAHTLAGEYMSKFSREYHLQALALPSSQLHLPVSSAEGCHGYVHNDVKPPST
eukprot:SM000259S08733  [mRNA]  locus=s259:55388:57501:+ [translate_table: standard]